MSHFAAFDQEFPVVDPAQEQAAEQFAALLAERRFDIANPPLPPVPVFRLGEAIIATPGNLVCIQAQAKAGKSAFVGAMLAAAMGAQGDCLGVVSDNPEKLALVHFDTEQSPADHHENIVRALRRAELETPPPWLRSYRLADVPLHTRRALLAFELERAAIEHGGVHSVIIDGVADLLLDPNDAAEAFALVDELHQTAIRYNAPIVCILHENPGSEFGKTRGHLGSQLERKAETNLRLAKDGDGVTVVFAEKARHAHIPKDGGTRFAWSDAAGMHVSHGTPREQKETARAIELRTLADEIFEGIPLRHGLAWSNVIERIRAATELSADGARKRLAAMLAAKVIKKREKTYFQGR